MTQVSGSIPITSDLALSFDRDLENFNVRIGSYYVQLYDRQLRITRWNRSDVVLSIPATVSVEGNT